MKKNPLYYMGHCMDKYLEWIEYITTFPTDDELNGIKVLDFKKFINTK